MKKINNNDSTGSQPAKKKTKKIKQTHRSQKDKKESMTNNKYEKSKEN